MWSSNTLVPLHRCVVSTDWQYCCQFYCSVSNTNSNTINSLPDSEESLLTLSTSNTMECNFQTISSNRPIAVSFKQPLQNFDLAKVIWMIPKQSCHGNQHMLWFESNANSWTYCQLWGSWIWMLQHISGAISLRGRCLELLNISQN